MFMTQRSAILMFYNSQSQQTLRDKSSALIIKISFIYHITETRLFGLVLKSLVKYFTYACVNARYPGQSGRTAPCHSSPSYSLTTIKLQNYQSPLGGFTCLVKKLIIKSSRKDSERIQRSCENAC